MTDRLLGPTGPERRRRLRTLIPLFALCLIVGAIGASSAGALTTNSPPSFTFVKDEDCTKTLLCADDEPVNQSGEPLELRGGWFDDAGARPDGDLHDHQHVEGGAAGHDREEVPERRIRRNGSLPAKGGHGEYRGRDRMWRVDLLHGDLTPEQVEGNST
jgi:hypothetical protein